MADITLLGVDELIKRLNTVAGRLADRSEGRALTKGAEVLRIAMSQNAPRSDLTKEHLADNIVRSKIKNTSFGIKYIEVGPNDDAYYGKFLEFGTVKMDAQPFMWPALEEKREEIFSTMAKVLREEIEKFR